MKKSTNVIALQIIIAGIVACILFANSSPAQQPRPVYIGLSVTIHSEILQEDRNILIYLPSSYDSNKDEKFPVMFLLDGFDHFHHVSGLVSFLAWAGKIPEMIVVGISNTDRDRDLTPPHNDGIGRDAGGRGDNFLAFLAKELIPYIDRHYRTRDYRLLVGHSLGGNFTIYNLITDPDLFDTYIAISPALGWTNNKLTSDTEKFLKKNPGLNKFLYLSMGQEGDRMIKPIEKFTNMLVVNAPDSLRWKYSFFKNDNHLSTPHKSIYEALEILYRGWQIQDSTLHQGLDAILMHYQSLASRFGYVIPPPERILNTAGYIAMDENKKDEAIKILSYAVELYPNSANVYDSLGDAYENKGEIELAAKYYAMAVEKGRANMDRNLRIYRANLERVQKLLNR